MVRSEHGSTKKRGKLFPKNVFESRGYIAGPAAPRGGGRWSERLPLVVSRTVGSALARRPNNLSNLLFVIWNSAQTDNAEYLKDTAEKLMILQSR